MVLEITVGAGALCGIIHRLGKLGVIPAYGYDSGREMPAWVKLLGWLHILGGFALIGNFESFESGLLFALAFLGAWKLSEEVAEVAFDLFEIVRRG